MPVSSRSVCSRSRIWAWTVTSSAVVGSSAISSSGSQASAMAIRARWRMPPLNSCGRERDRRAASGMPDPVQHLDGTRACRPPGHARVHAVHLGDLVADRVVRVEGGQRVLEDHRGLSAAQPPQLLVRGPLHVGAGDLDRAADARSRAPVQPEQGGGDGGLAGAGLADEGEGGALFQAEGEPVDGAQGAELDA